MADNKIKFSISMDPALVKRIDAVAEVRGEGRATVIERMCDADIVNEEVYLNRLENPMFRKIHAALWSHPRLLETLATMVGEKFSEEELDRGSKAIPELAKRIGERSQSKRKRKLATE